MKQVTFILSIIILTLNFNNCKKLEVSNESRATFVPSNTIPTPKLSPKDSLENKLNEPDTALIEAVDENDENKVEALLQQGANPNTIKWDPVRVNIYGNTVLDIAVLSGNIKITKSLLKHGANVDIGIVTDNGNSPSLSMAVCKDDLTMINILLDNGADIKNASFVCASKEKTVALLVKKGANINDFLDGEKTALMIEVGTNNYKKVRMLVKYGAEVNLKNSLGYTALDYVRDGEGGGNMSKLLKDIGAKK